MFLGELPADTQQLVDCLNHVNRDADGACLVCNGSCDGLAYPPRSISRKFKPTMVVELFYRANKPDVALLKEVQQGHSSTYMLLGHAHDQPEVGLYKMFLRFLRFDVHDFQVVGELLFVSLDGLTEFLIFGKFFHAVEYFFGIDLVDYLMWQEAGVQCQINQSLFDVGDRPVERLGQGHRQVLVDLVIDGLPDLRSKHGFFETSSVFEPKFFLKNVNQR